VLSVLIHKTPLFCCPCFSPPFSAEFVNHPPWKPNGTIKTLDWLSKQWTCQPGNCEGARRSTNSHHIPANPSSLAAPGLHPSEVFSGIGHRLSSYMSVESTQVEGGGSKKRRRSWVQTAEKGKHASSVRGNATEEITRFFWNSARLNEVRLMDVSFCQGGNKKCQ
jgi:hypothetical protein